MLAKLLHAEEARRLHAFARVAVLLLVLVLAQVPWLGGDPQRKLAAAIAMALMTAVSLWAVYRTADQERFTPTVYRVFGYSLVTLIFVVVHWMGFFSPVTVTLSLGIYSLGQSHDRPHALLLPLYVAAGWAGGAILTAFGVVADLSLYRIAALDQASRVLMVTGVAGTLGVSAWAARFAHRSLQQAVRESLSAALVAQRRGALLDEARDQLDRAMKHALGKPGVHSERTAGAYRLAEVIGLGAMGEVYAAKHTTTDAPAAVKLLHADALQREDMVVRFLREAELCVRFNHPNIVRVLEVGRMDDGAPYMAMERLEGEPLATLLRERAQLSLQEVVQLSNAVGDGLAHAHDNGVIHRDLKPHNILQAGEGRGRSWKIVDFGISKVSDSSGTLTGDERVLGTPAYMSPEQARGDAVDLRSDVFSLGSVLYRALTGRPAFPGADVPRIMFDVTYSMPAQPTSQLPGVPVEVDLVFALMFAKRPEQRFASATELTEALRGAARGRLSNAYRERANEILSQRPWGSRPAAPG